MPESQPPRALPPRASIEFLKKTARERLDALRAGDPSAKLADAQLALAREYGFPSWRAMVAKIESDSPPAKSDDELKKLHAQFRAAVNAGRIDELGKILDAHPDLVNAPIFSFGGRPIANATRFPALVDLLLERGADINLRSDWWAGSWGILDMAEGETAEMLIQRGAIVDVFAAAHLNKLDRLRELLTRDPTLVHSRGGDGCRPLHFARSAEAVDLILSNGAEIDARDIDHESTAAQWATMRPPGQGGADKRHVGMQHVRMLVDRGAATDVFMAAALGDTEILRNLLDHDPAAIDRRVGGPDYPPCPVAPGKHIYVYTLTEGSTPLQIAAAFGNDGCIDFLMSRSNPRQRFLAACTIADEKRAREALAAEPGLIKALTPQDYASLPAAAWAGNLPAVKLMLDFGFDPLTPGADTGTALHCAAWQGRADIVNLFLTHSSTRPRQAELVNAIEPTHHGTPLGWCCHGSTNRRNPAGDYPTVARMLLDAGSPVSPNFGDATDAVKQVILHYRR